MIRFSWRRLLNSLVSPTPCRGGQRRLRKAVPPYRPQLEGLEDRWVPAIQLTYGGPNTALMLTEVSAASDNVTISEPVAGTLRIDLNGDTFDAGSTAAATGLTYETAGDPANSTFATIDIGTASNITDIVIDLGAQDDILAIGFTNASGGISGQLSIDAGAGANDAVTLNALSLQDDLTVTAETINLAGDIATDGSGTSAGSVQLTGAIVLQASVSIDTDAPAGTDGDVTFTGTVNADDAAANDWTLSVTADTGTISFQNSIGNTQALADLDVMAATINLTGPTIQVDDGAGGQTVTFDGAVVLTGNVSIDTDGTNDNNVTFTGTVNADAVANNRTLSVDAGSGDVTFSAAVGDLQAVQTLMIDDADDVSLQTVTTTDGGLKVVVTGTDTPSITLNDDIDTTVGTADAGSVILVGADSLTIDILITTNTANAGANDGNICINENGALVINQAIDAGTATVRLVSGDTVSQNSPGTITAAGLGVRAVNAITLGLAGNTVDSFAASAGGAVVFQDADGFTVGTITADASCSFAQTDGISATDSNVCLNSGTGSLTINQAIAAGTGTVRLVSGDSVTQNSPGTITAAGLGVQAVNAITLNLAGNDVDTFAAQTTAAAATIAFSESDGFTVGTITADASCGFVQTDGISTNNGDISLTSTGLLTIGDATGQDITAGTARTDLNTAGASENAGSIITATGLRLQGTGSFTLNQANQIDTLAAATNGGVSFNDASDIAVDTVLGTNGISTANGNVCLNSGTGSLTINQAINAGGGTVRLVAGTTITQSGAGTITAGALGVQASGNVSLGLSNDVGTFAGTAGGSILFQDANSLTIGDVGADGSCGFSGASGVQSSTQSITINTGADLTVASGLSTPGQPITLNVGTNLTISAGINAGGGTITANVGLNGTAIVNVRTQLVAGQAIFNGGNAVAAGGIGDQFFITPSASAPILVNGAQPTLVPGDSLSLIGLGGTTVTQFSITSADPASNSKSGFFSFNNRQTVTFTGIESVGQVNITVVAVQTGIGTFQIQAAVNFNNQQIQGNIQVQNAVTPPFFLAPNLVNPFQPFGGPRVAVGDVTGDGLGDLIIGFGPGTGPLVTVINGQAVIRASNGGAGVGTGDVLTQFFAYDPSFVGGIFVAAGDINGDGRAEIVTGNDAGALGHVRSFTNVSGNITSVVMQQLPGPLGSFFAFDTFRGGVRVAVGDINNDGRADIIVGAGPGAGPHVKAFDGASGGLLLSFFAFDPSFSGGVFVSAGNFDSSGGAEILVGAGFGAPANVKMFDVNQTLLASFIAFQSQPVFLTPFPNSPIVLSGVGGVAFGGLNPNTGRLDILVSTGRGARTQVFKILSDFLMANAPFIDTPFLDGASLGGVVVSSST
jgi:FG-GAP-like repeat